MKADIDSRGTDLGMTRSVQGGSQRLLLVCGVAAGFLYVVADVVFALTSAS
jgi:hypothetical protein